MNTESVGIILPLLKKCEPLDTMEKVKGKRTLK